MSQPVFRYVYRAQCLPGQEERVAATWRARQSSLAALQADGHLLTAAVFGWQGHCFVYYEATDPKLSPEDLAGEAGALLEEWPGAARPRRFAPMMDIFHCGEPRGTDEWRRATPVESVRARLTRLKPEMVSSYIFYHYQRQEERPGDFDKYCLITIHEDLLFFYQESPAVVESPPRTGKLSTRNSPENWHEVMFPHFRLWDDAAQGEEIWREIGLLLHIPGR